MKAFLSNRYIDALVKTLFFMASFHIAIIVVIAIRTNIDALNAFVILNLDTFIPGLAHGPLNFVLSYCLVLAVYLLVFWRLTEPNQKSQ